MKGSPLFDPADIVISLAALDKEGVLAELADRIAQRYPAVSADTLLRLLLERESLGSTGIGDGIAIPHCKLASLESPLLLFARSDSGIDFKAIDDKPVRLVFLLVAPEEEVGVHLKLLARISHLLKRPGIREQLIKAVDAVEIAAILMEKDKRL